MEILLETFLPPERLLDFSVTTGLVLTWYLSVKSTIKEKTEKRLSWILTLLSAIVSTFGCLPVVYDGYVKGFPSDIMYGNDRISRGLVNFFVSYLLWDTVFIYTDYPSVGGIHHHLPYFIFMAFSLHYRCPAMFVVFMPMELSSIFLSVGHIWPPYRADLWFGITFFLGRIVYHFLLWLRLYATRGDSPFIVWPFALLPLAVHIQWFTKWLMSMYKKYKENKRKARGN